MTTTITITIDTINIVCGPLPTSGTLHWVLGPVTTKEQPPMPQEAALTTEQKVLMTVTPMTPGGQPGRIDGDAAWSVEAGEGTIEPVDATSAWFVTGTTPGDVTILVQADADLGEGVVQIQDTALFHVSNPMAASLGLSVGEPELKV